MTTRLCRRFAPFLAAAALTLTACGTDASTDSGNPGNGSGNGGELSGTIRIDGSSTVLPLSEAAAEAFMAEHPGVQVTVASSGTGGGFEKFCNGETDISNASRPIADDEQAACEQAGIDHEQITVANDALSVMVNRENPVECLSIDQLHQIWGPDSTVSNWSEIDGLDANFDQALDLYGPGTDSGTFDYFTEAINGAKGAQRTDYNNIGEDDNSGIIGVEASVGGMFYAGYSYYIENQERIKALGIDNGNGCVKPSAETVQDGSYQPLARGLFVYPSAEALQRPEVQAFVEFSIENAAQIAQSQGYVGLTEQQRHEATNKVTGLVE